MEAAPGSTAALASAVHEAGRFTPESSVAQTQDTLTGVANSAAGGMGPLSPSSFDGPMRKNFRERLGETLGETLQSAQVCLLDKTSSRQILYLHPGEAQASLDSTAEDGPSASAPSRYRSSRSDSKMAKLQAKAAVDRGFAYMGIDWYEIAVRQKKVSKLFIVENMYYWCYAAYIVFLIALGSVALCMGGLNGNDATFATAIFMSAACVTQSGLTVVDWSKQSTSTYATSLCLILLGSGSLLHCVPVILREFNFRKQMNLCAPLYGRSASTQSTESLEPSTVDRPPSGTVPGGTVRPQSADLVKHTVTTHGATPRSASTSCLARPAEGGEAVLASRGVKRAGTATLSDGHRLEYKALQMVLKIVLSYICVMHVIGFAVFFVYLRFFDQKLQDQFSDLGLHPAPHALYLSISSFQNNGLCITPSSVMSMAESPFLLGFIGALIVLGNTGLPIMIRLIVVVLQRRAREDSERRRALDFLLEHPRRCFTMLFPAVHTLWLLLVLLAMIATLTSVILWQDYDSPAMHGLSGWAKVYNALFQSTSIRTAGMNSVDIAGLSQSTTFLIAMMMYLGTTPVVVTMRFSSVGQQQELDITGRLEGVDEEMFVGDNSLRAQAKRVLSQDISFLVLCVFLICWFENGKFSDADNGHTLYRAGDVYGEFTFFKVFFELASAYGTCGLSLGLRDQVSSFSGVWTIRSQMVLVAVMVMGRLRGLPDSIDPSVRVKLQTAPAGEKEHCFVHA